MKKVKAMQVMSALSQPTRLDVFTRLVSVLPAGLAAGDLAVATKTAPSALSAHLAILSRAGLVKSTKVGRSVVYRGKTAAVDDLIAFLAGIAGSSGGAGDANDAAATVDEDARPERGVAG